MLMELLLLIAIFAVFGFAATRIEEYSIALGQASCEFRY
ncbi:hypothetical protein BH23CHL5_BH23CHL5_20200 [soil metagenome]